MYTLRFSRSFGTKTVVLAKCGVSSFGHRIVRKYGGSFLFSPLTGSLGTCQMSVWWNHVLAFSVW